MSIAEAERFPEGARRYFDVVFTQPQEQLGTYLRETFTLTDAASAQAAEKLLGSIIYPHFPRALFGRDTLTEEMEDDALRANLDLAPIRQTVVALLQSLDKAPVPV